MINRFGGLRVNYIALLIHLQPFPKYPCQDLLFSILKQTVSIARRILDIGHWCTSKHINSFFAIESIRTSTGLYCEVTRLDTIHSPFSTFKSTDF